MYATATLAKQAAAVHLAGTDLADHAIEWEGQDEDEEWYGWVTTPAGERKYWDDYQIETFDVEGT